MNFPMTAAVLAACAVAQSAHAADLRPRSLCGSDETIYFSCKIEHTRDYASVCAKDNTAADAGYVQYRYGHDAASAFRFPASKVAPGDTFHILTVNHFRDGIGKHLTFSNGAYTYVVSNAVQPPEIGVFRNGKSVATKTCEFDNGFTPISNDADFGIKPGEKSGLDSFDGS
ncbi:hypothetical protein [Burkholderia perseverans]|uniref:hypothetical protein n=1 Tax=Burkholderia perseverans TaxID=2615214 RepID=UPI001FED3877|nr:hypothetical protein [Burkholderia perseverans]